MGVEGNGEVAGLNDENGSPGVRQSGVSDRGRLQGHGSRDHSITPETFSTHQPAPGLVKLLLTLSVCSL